MTEFRGADGWLYKRTDNGSQRISPPEPPTEGAILERSASLANTSANAAGLQVRRIRGSAEHSRDTSYDPWDRLYDCQFLIGALWRFRSAIGVAAGVPDLAPEIAVLLDRFDASLTGLRKMRNVLEHENDYGVDAHHFDGKRASSPEVHRQQLQTMRWDDDSMTWLGETLVYSDALQAVDDCYRGLMSIVGTWRQASSLK